MLGVVSTNADGGSVTAQVERVAHYAEAATAEGTRRAYATDIRAWQAWCAERGAVPVPADPLTVAAYLTHLADNGASPVTVARRLSAISHAHRSAGHLAPSEHDGVRRVMRGIRRESVRAGYRPKKARALDTPTVRALVEDLPATTSGARDKAMLLLGFALGLRASDLVWLDAEDITAASRGDGLDIRIRFSKTDQDGAGEVLALASGTRASTCPVAAVSSWLQVAGITTGPLFRPVDKAGRVAESRLTTRSVGRILARAARRSGVPADRLSPHSLRRGFATAAYEAGTPEREIQRVGRWRTAAILRGYDDTGRWADPVSARLGL
jgi:site-specific recombinase XerD